MSVRTIYVCLEEKELGECNCDVDSGFQAWLDSLGKHCIYWPTLGKQTQTL